LGVLKQASPAVVGLLMQTLGDESAAVRGRAAEALSRLVEAIELDDALWLMQSLKPALKSDLEFEARYYPLRWNRVKDNAFQWLEQLSQRSGQPIYTDEAGV
jgi:hypothetical protein